MTVCLRQSLLVDSTKPLQCSAQDSIANTTNEDNIMVQGPSGRKLQQEAYPGVGAVARTVSANLSHCPAVVCCLFCTGRWNSELVVPFVES